MPLIRKGPTEPIPPNPPADAAASLAALQGGSVQERWAAARSMAGFPSAIANLGSALVTEKDERVREAIFSSLARINSVESADAIIAHVRSDDSNLRTGALDALKVMPVPVSAKLEALLQDSDADVRILACELARIVPIADATRLLSRLLESDGEVNVCAAAVDILAEIGSPDALPALAQCAKRFPNEPFLGFSIKTASERIGAQHPPRHG